MVTTRCDARGARYANDASCVCARSATRWRRAGICLVVAAFLIAQLTVPLVGLHTRGGFPFAPGDDLTDWTEGQIYFTWQMYSVSRTPATYTLIERDGARREVNPVARYGWLAGRAHYTGQTARRLCEDHPEAVAVRHAFRTVSCGDG